MSSIINFQSPFIIEETTGKDFLILKACLLKEGMTGNGRYYEFSDFKKIAKDLVGKVVQYGATVGGKHLKRKMDKIGEVIETWVDEKARKIIGRIKVWNTKFFPRITETIMSFGKGMGISVGGKGGLQPILRDGLPVLIKTGHGFLAKVVNFIAKHIQLIPPNVPRGQEDAKVLDIEESLAKIQLVPIQETLMVNPEIQIVFSYPKGSDIRIIY